MARILVVDDQPDWQATLRGLLADAGHDVTTAGDEGTALAAAVQMPLELAIVDVRLHGDDEDDDSGLSLALALKKLAPQMKVILLTGYPVRADQVVKSIRFVGVENFIEKSKLETADGIDLHEIIKGILDKPPFEPSLCQLSISLELGQPVMVRSRGSHVHAIRTDWIFKPSVPAYTRLAQEARAAPDPRFNIKTIGQDLYRDIFRQQVLVTFATARAEGQPLCLSFEGARDLIGIPFEFIFLGQPEEYLVLEHPVTRFINGVVPGRKALSPETFAQLKGELRVLIIASNTDPAIPGVDRETQQLADFLRSQSYVSVRVNLIPTEEATVTRVRQELKDCQAHIVHYAGHGEYNVLSPEESVLFFWSEESRTATTSDQEGGQTLTRSVSRQKPLTKLRQILITRFDEGELRTLCFDLGVRYDSLPGEGTANKARELVDYLERRGRVSELIRIGEQQRPDILWGDALEVTEEPLPASQGSHPERLQGDVETLTAAELRGLLHNSEVRFAYFSCCHGAATGSQDKLLDDDFLGIADAVIQAGVPSVLGYRWPVSDGSAIRLTLAFYQSLLSHGSPEIALWQARREIANQDRDDLTWLSPIIIHQV